MLRIYIGGGHTAITPADVDRNIIDAREAMAALLRMSHAPFCPHTMTARFERDFPDIHWTTYIRTDSAWVEVSDAIFMLPGWEDSNGFCGEHEFAKRVGIPVYYSLEEVPKA